MKEKPCNYDRGKLNKTTDMKQVSKAYANKKEKNNYHCEEEANKARRGRIEIKRKLRPSQHKEE